MCDLQGLEEVEFLGNVDREDSKWVGIEVRLGFVLVQRGQVVDWCHYMVSSWSVGGKSIGRVGRFGEIKEWEEIELAQRKESLLLALRLYWKQHLSKNWSSVKLGLGVWQNFGRWDEQLGGLRRRPFVVIVEPHTEIAFLLGKGRPWLELALRSYSKYLEPSEDFEFEIETLY